MVEWVQCDDCKKWRSLPAGHSATQYAGEDEIFLCHMHPLRAWRNCSVPEEEWVITQQVNMHLILNAYDTVGF